MRVQDVERFWQRQAAEPDPVEAEHKVQLHCLSVLISIANGQAFPDPAALAQAVIRGVAGECQIPEIRYVQSSDAAESGDSLS